MKFQRIVLTVLAAMLLLTGCQTQPTLNRRLLIRGIGIDLQEDGKYLASIHAMDAGQGENDRVKLLQAEGDSVFDALNHLTMKTGDTPLYSQNLVVIFGKSCLEEGLEKALDFFIRYNETRPTVDVFLSDTTAEDILSVQQDGEYLLTQTIDALADSEQLNAQVVHVRILDLVNLQYAGGSPYLPILRAEEGSVSLKGTAVLKNGKLAGELSSDQTRGLLLLTKGIARGTEVIENKDVGKITFLLSGSDCTVETDLSGKVPEFRIKVTCNANISAIDGAVEQAMGREYYEIFEEQLQERMERLLTDTIETTIQEMNCDVFRFGRRIQQESPEFWRETEDDWEELMTESEYIISVETDIQRVGKENTPDISKT